MQLYGNGVTRNFLQILEGDLQRTAKALARIAVLTGLVALVAYFALHRNLWVGIGSFLGALLLSAALGLAWAQFVSLRRYEASIRDHWNRWMRFSVSCVSVRECYAKVHSKPPQPSWWVGGLLLAGLFLAHVVLGVLALNESASFRQTFALFGFDALLLGFFAGVRVLERVWYQRFLKSVNEMLQDGSIGIWGVY